MGSPDPGTALETSDFYVLHYFNYPNLKKYICKHIYIYIYVYKNGASCHDCLQFFFGGDVSSFFSVQIAFRFFMCRDFSLDFLVENSHLKDFLVEISLHIVLGYSTPIPLENQVG